MEPPELGRREVLGAVALSAASAGCLALDAIDPTSPPGDRTVHVTVGGDEAGFQPDRLAVEPGDTVVWEWLSGTHDLTGIGAPVGTGWQGHSVSGDGGDRYEHSFETPGSYRYQCVRHMDAGTRGEIVVVDTDEPPYVDVSVGADGEATVTPERVEVDRETTVVWTWASDGHSLTPTSTPYDARWDGHPEPADTGTEYLQTFEVPGTYEYECEKHSDADTDTDADANTGADVDTGADADTDADADTGADTTGEIAVAGPDGAVPVEVVAGPRGETAFEPERLEVQPGTTVRWVWGPDLYHSVTPVSVPDDAEWEGHPDVVDDRNVYVHTFDVEGTYEYQCEPHSSAGMTGSIVVQAQ